MVAGPTQQSEPIPVGALFEAAFRRFGARVSSYTLYSIAFAVPAAVAAFAVRDLAADRGTLALSIFVACAGLGHFALAGTLTALVTGTLRRRFGQIAVAAAIGGLVSGMVFEVVGPFVLVLYPILVFASIAAAADAPAIGAFRVAVRLVVTDVGRTFAALVGLGLCAALLFFGFQVALSSVGGEAQIVATFALTYLMLSPLAALVERNLYGDLTGRIVLPPTVDPQQRTRRGRR